MSAPPGRMSLAYVLGRKSAPLLFKLDWIVKSLTGTESEQIAAEFKLGCLLARVYEEKIPSTENNRLSETAARLVDRLRNKERRFAFKCDQSGVLNALAIPGGFVYVSERLLDLCGEDRDALAFVLAHEIAHAINGDANKRFLTKTAVVALSRVPLLGKPSAAQSLFAQLVQQGYSREQELRADRFGFALVKAAGFDPAGGIRLMEMLGRHAREPGLVGAWLSSHPAMPERIEQIKRLVREG